jgi:hypothetical protein
MQDCTKPPLGHGGMLPDAGGDTVSRRAES